MKYSATSIHQRLLNFSRKEKQDFNRLLTLYAHERFLARLSKSTYQKYFVLKGGLYLYSQFGQAARPTRDLDLLGQQIANDQANMLELFHAIIQQDLNDGIKFDASTLTATVIKEDANYEGIRLKLVAYLGKTRAHLQIDVGFGDALYPAAETIEYPTLLELEALSQPKLLAYNLETVIAEKLHAMTILGTSNSRLKDFYDIWLMSQEQNYEATILFETINRTFERRGNKLEESNFLFAEAFVMNEKMSLRWEQFKAKNPLGNPSSFEGIMIEIRAFLEPLLVYQTKGVWHPQEGKWFV